MRLLTLILLIILIPLGLWYSDDMQQLNRHEIFMGENLYKSYRHFQSLVHEKQILLVKLNFEGPLQTQDYQHIQAWKKTQQESWDEKNQQIKFSLFEDFYALAAKTSDWPALLEFRHQHPHLLLPLIDSAWATIMVSFPSTLKAQESIEVTNAIISSLKKLAHDLKATPHWAGVPAINYQVARYGEIIKKQLFPLVFALCALMLYFFLGHLAQMLAIFIPSIASTVMALVALKFFYHHMNMISSLIPLMTFIIHTALGLHLYFAYKKCSSLPVALKEKYAPMALMLFTTCTGLLGLSTSSMPVIAQFAVASACIILVSAFLHLLYAWALYPYCQKWAKRPSRFNLEAHFEKFLAPTLKPLPLIPLYLFILFCTVFGFWAYRHLPLNTEAATYFPAKERVLEDLKDVEEHVLGHPNYELLIKAKDQHPLQYQDFLAIEKIEKEIQELLGEKSKALSQNNFVKEINQIYANSDQLPAHKSAYAVIRAQIPQEVRDSYQQGSFYRLSLFGPLHATSDYWPEREKLEQYRRQFSGPYTLELNGLYTQLMNSQSDLLSALKNAIASTLLIITLCALIFTRNFKWVWAFSLANIVPLFALALFMKLAHLSINAATAMTFSVALGLIVDSSFHIIHAHKQQMSGKLYLHNVVLPIFYSNILLTLAFSTFAFYSFLPIAEFGPSLAFAIFIGLIYDLLVLPALLGARFHQR